MATPKVSICLPTYNQPDYLRLVLDSIVIQDFKDYEVIVSDDSTNNDSGILVEEYRDKIPNLRYVKNEPKKGSPGSWNEAVKNAKGELIKVQHSDDWFTNSTALGEFVAMLDANPQSDFAFSAANVCSPEKKITRVHSPNYKEISKLRQSPNYLFGRNIVGAPSATIYRASVVHKYYDQKLKWAVDVDQYINILQENPNFQYCPKPLVCTTDGASHQSSHGSVGLKKVELFEWLYVYSKIRKSSESKDEKIQFRLFMKLYIAFILERCRISNMSQIEDVTIEPEERKLVSNLLKMKFLFLIFKIRRNYSKFK